MQHRLVAVLAVLFLFAGEARAECPVGAIPGALTARVDQAAVKLLEPTLIDQIPAEIPVPSDPYKLMDCAEPVFEDTIATLYGAVVDLDVLWGSVTLESGALVLDAALDIATAGTLDLQMCAAPNAICPVALSSRSVQVHGVLEPRVTDCSLSLPLSDVQITVDPEATDITLSDCGLYDELWQLAYDWFRDTILAMVTAKVEAAVAEMLPPCLETFTSGLFANDYEMMGLRFYAVPESLAVDAGELRVQLAGDVSSVGPRGACLPADARMPPQAVSAPEVTLNPTAMLSAAVSQPLLERAARAAWLAGWMCFDTRDYGLQLGSYLETLAPGAVADATVAVTSPPSVTLGAGDTGNQIQVSAADLTAELQVTVPGAPTSVVTASLGAMLSGNVRMNDDWQALALELAAAESSDIRVAAPGTALVFPEEVLAGLIERQVMPAFASLVGQIPITSALFAFSPVAVRVSSVGVRRTFLRADFDLAVVDASDVEPPRTSLVSWPANPSPATLELEMASFDDTTPRDFMRHRVILDGVRDASLYSGTTLVLRGLSAGVHHVIVTAVDLNGNIDRSPPTLTINVDDTPPVVTITPPLGVLRESEVTLSFDASDDWTASSSLILRYTVGLIRVGQPDELLEEGRVTTTDGLVVSNLPEDQVVRVTVFATDSAGNEGKAFVAFASSVEPTLGCSAAGPCGLGWLACAGLVAGLARRRGPASRPS